MANSQMKIVIIGAGAAGLMAAYFALKNGANVCILEQNEKCGKKIYITGKGRCNICNACSDEEFLQNVVSNSKFLYASLSEFNANDIIKLFESLGCTTKIERGSRMFPLSDKASDVTNALSKAVLNMGGRINLNAKVSDILVQNNAVVGVKLDNGKIEYANSVIIATGGKSYPGTGSTGDGYNFLKNLGHRIIDPQPALVPLNSSAQWVHSLQGLSLKNVKLSLIINKKLIYEELGEMLFTHFGISGPLVLSASSYLAGKDISKAKIMLNLKPALSAEQLDKRILREIELAPNKQIISTINKLYPLSLAETMLKLCNINLDLPANQLNKKQRTIIINNTLCLNIPISSMRSINEAIITHGGADIKQFNPSSMESKLIKGLYAAGEVLDLDALTGGFNMQIAFITGRKAGISAANKTEIVEQ